MENEALRAMRLPALLQEGNLSAAPSKAWRCSLEFSYAAAAPCVTT